MRAFRVSNVLPIGDSFSEQNMQLRESKILDAVRAGFKDVIPQDVLEFSEAQANPRNPAFLVSYSVRAGNSLYYEDTLHGSSFGAGATGPFYPGISIDWAFEIRIPETPSSYRFTLKSAPASHFTAANRSVYDSMAQSAFDDFRSELARRLGIHAGP
jgi:hypothetical protein